MKQRSQKKIAAKEEKRRKHRRAVEIVREATRKALSTPNRVLTNSDANKPISQHKQE